jgi:hypothetical protein
MYIYLQVGICVFRLEILLSAEVLGYDKWWLFPVLSTLTKTLLLKSSVLAVNSQPLSLPHKKTI